MKNVLFEERKLDEEKPKLTLENAFTFMNLHLGI